MTGGANYEKRIAEPEKELAKRDRWIEQQPRVDTRTLVGATTTYDYADDGNLRSVVLPAGSTKQTADEASSR